MIHHRHPVFGHTLSTEYSIYHMDSLSLKGPILHIQAKILRVEPDVCVRRSMHHHLLVHQVRIVSIFGADPSIVSDEIFCAIRYGDARSFLNPIPELREGNPIELKGEYIDRNHAYPSVGNPGDPVLHFTHHPLGYVIYDNVYYE
jgi:hypothetical protein